MPIPTSCSCGAKLQAPDAAAGRKVKCPKCGTGIVVPGGKAPAAAPSKAAAPATLQASKPAAPAPARASKPAAAAAPAPAKASKAVAEAPPPSKPRPKPAEPPSDADDAEAEGPSAWEQARVLQHNEWTFQEQGWLRVNVKNRHFHICKAATKDVVGYADEKASGLFLALRALNNLGKWLPTTVEIRDEQDGPLLLSIRKVNLPLLPWTDIEIYDDQRKKLGYFRTKIFSLLGGFWLYDAEGQEVAEVKAKLGMPPRYLFLSKDGRELGSVANEVLAKVAETKKMQVSITTPFNRPSLRLKVSPEMENEPRIKALMLATVLAFEFTGVGNRLLK